MNQPETKKPGILVRFPRALAWIAGIALSFTTIGGTVAGVYVAGKKVIDDVQTVTQAAAEHEQISSYAETMVAELSIELSDSQERSTREARRIRIDAHEREIANLEYQLLSHNLNSQQRAYLERQIQRLRDEIACIRRGEC